MFPLEIPESKEVRVWDSTSDVRYFVLPQRPTGAEGMPQEELAKLVTVDSLIGAGYALEPAQQQAAERQGTIRRSAQSSPGLRGWMESNSKYKIGDAVMIAAENPAGNPRTPRYIRGKRGIIGSVHGILENIRDHRGIHKPLYTVRFEPERSVDLPRSGFDLGRMCMKSG